MVTIHALRGQAQVVYHYGWVACAAAAFASISFTYSEHMFGVGLTSHRPDRGPREFSPLGNHLDLLPLAVCGSSSCLSLTHMVSADAGIPSQPSARPHPRRRAERRDAATMTAAPPLASPHSGRRPPDPRLTPRSSRVRPHAVLHIGSPCLLAAFGLHELEFLILPGLVLCQHFYPVYQSWLGPTHRGGRVSRTTTPCSARSSTTSSARRASTSRAAGPRACSRRA